MYGETFYGRHTAQHQLQWRQIKSKMSFFKRNETIHKKGDGSYYVVSAIKPRQWPYNDPARKNKILILMKRVTVITAEPVKEPASSEAQWFCSPMTPLDHLITKK